MGKTTTAINLSASLALGGRAILIVDSDPQCNTTTGLGLDRAALKKNLYELYVKAVGGNLKEVTLHDYIIKTEIDHLYLLPASVDLLAVEVELVEVKDREFVLAKVLEPLREKYEYIIVDCPPSLGLLTLNALVAADSVIIPVQCEYYALEGLGLLSNTISLVQKSFNPKLKIEGVLLTMYDQRTVLSKQVAEEVKNVFGSTVYETVIPRNVTLSEAPSHGRPAILYDARSKGAQSYLQLAKELIHEDGLR